MCREWTQMLQKRMKRMRRMISMIEMSLFEARRCCIYSASYLVSLQVSYTCWKLALVGHDHLCVAVAAVVVLLVTEWQVL